MPLFLTHIMNHVNTNRIPNTLDDNLIPKRYDSVSMADKEQPRSIRFPQRLWDAIDRDAVRCGRSAVKQLEVLLSAYYGLRNVELDYDRLQELGSNSLQKGIPVAPRSQKGIPLINRRTDVSPKKKTKRTA